MTYFRTVVYLAVTLAILHAAPAAKRGWNVRYDGETTNSTLHRAIAMQGSWRSWLYATDLVADVEFIPYRNASWEGPGLVGEAAMYIGQAWPLLELTLQSGNGEVRTTWDGATLCQTVRVRGATGEAARAELAERGRQAAGVLLAALPLPFTLLDSRSDHRFAGNIPLPYQGRQRQTVAIESSLNTPPGSPFPERITCYFDQDHGFLLRSRLVGSAPLVAEAHTYRTFGSFNFATYWRVFREREDRSLVPLYSLRVLDLKLDTGTRRKDYRCP